MNCRTQTLESLRDMGRHAAQLLDAAVLAHDDNTVRALLPICRSLSAAHTSLGVTREEHEEWVLRRTQTFDM